MNWSFNIRTFAVGQRFLLLLFLFVPALVYGQVRVSLSRSQISLGENAIATITLDGLAANQEPEFSVPNGLNSQLVGDSNLTRMINGAVAQSRVMQYMITANKAGDYTLGPAKIKMGNRVIQSQPSQLKVVAAGQNAGNAKAADDAVQKMAFLQLVVPKTEYYLGEVFPVEMNLYFQSARADMPQLKSDGFALSNPPQHLQNRVRIGNGTYQQHSFRYAGRALKSGEVTFGPAECNIDIQIPVQDTDPFFGGIIQRYRSQSTQLKSDPIKLTILPLPTENRPASFNGAIGKFVFRASVSKTQVSVGDPISINVEITGQGAWDAVQLPAFDAWRDFKIYPPNNEFARADELGIQGAKKFEIIVVPENSDVKEIPALSFSYFDPELKNYQTITQPAVPIRVLAANSAPAQPSVTVGKATAPPANETPVANDILHIKPHFGLTASLDAPALGRPWFWLLNAFPLVGWAVLTTARKRAERLAGDPRNQRRKAVQESEAVELPKLRELARSKDVKAFYDLLTKLLQERLGERLNLPAASITESIVEEQLAPMGMTEALRNDVHALFHASNQARYASFSEAAGLEEVAEQAAKVLAALATWEGKR